MRRVPLRPVYVKGGLVYIPLTQGKQAVVDLADLPLVAGRNWYAHEDRNTPGLFYAHSKARNDQGQRITLKMHRVILGCLSGDIADHRDGNGLNNRRSNLRVATIQQNTCNSKRPANNTSGFKGVTKRPSGRFESRIRFNGELTHLGVFDTAEQAHDAYVAKARELHGEFARVA